MFSALKKKLRAIGSTVAGRPVTVWISSIVNHRYWCVMSTPLDAGDLLVAKWQSIIDHVLDRHDGFDEPFPWCAHGPLEGRERQKPWLQTGTIKIRYN